MILPELPIPASDRRVVQAFTQAADVLEHEAKRAFSGACLSIGGIFITTSTRLRECADVIENRAGRGYSARDRKALRRAQDQFWNVGWFLHSHRDRFEEYRAAVNSRALSLRYPDRRRVRARRILGD
jgi:hypothetical protein